MDGSFRVNITNLRGVKFRRLDVRPSCGKLPGNLAFLLKRCAYICQRCPCTKLKHPNGHFVPRGETGIANRTNDCRAARRSGQRGRPYVRNLQLA